MKKENYSKEVHKGLFEKDTILGIPQIVFGLLLIVGVLLVFYISKWCFIPVFIVFFVMRKICKKDSQLLQLVVKNLFWKDIYEK